MYRFGVVVRALSSVVAVSLAAGCSESGTEAEPAPASPGALLSLAVSPLDLTPAFSPDVHDYVVRCVAGDNALSLAFETTPGATLSVSTPSATLSDVPQSISVTLSEDDPVVVQTMGRGAGQQYWVRCLPHDFPTIQFTPHPEVGTPTPGWYLTGNATAATGESGFAMILDGNGTPIWYERGGTTGVMNVDRLPDGTMSYIAALGAFGSDPNAEYVVQKLAPWQTRYVQATDYPIDEHELQVLPNGDVLVLSYPFVEGFDLTGLASYGTNSTLADCTILEISPSGSVVWTWRASDHIDAVKESVSPSQSIIDGLDVIDAFHLNSIDVDASGNLLVSARDLSAVWYVDKASGKIVWKMGGKPYSKDGAQIIRVLNDPEITFGYQHDARFQPNGDVSLFDDHGTPGVARGVEYEMDFTNGTATFVWQYEGPVASTAMGSFRRYPDGSSVISWGLSPKNPAAFTEVDDQGNDLLDVSFGGDGTYRTVKVPIETFDPDVLRVTAGHS